jgi:cytochrome P450
MSQTPTLGRPVEELPPGPKSSAVWQLIRFTHDPLRLLEECAETYGDCFTLNVAGHGRFVMVSDPEAVREIFRGDPDVLHSGEANDIFSATVGRSSVLVLDGPAHARQRRVLVPPVKGERMRAFFEAMRSETLDAVRDVPIDQAFATLPMMRSITLRVILRAGLGLPAGPTLDEFERKVEVFLANGRQRHALILMTVVPIHRFSRSRWVPLFRQLNALNDDIYALISARRRGDSSAVSENVLDDLLAATHEDGRPLDDQEVRDALITILIAGHDTTALALAWAIIELSSHPEASDRVRDELVRVTGGGPPEAAHLPALEYLDAAIRESLRLRPVAPFVVRLTKQSFEAGGRHYPAGVVLCPSSYLVHRRVELYPEPGQYRPERFLGRKFGSHEWFPFGGGNRVCLGMPFALYEMKVLLATLFSQVRLGRPDGAQSRPRRYGIVLGPDDAGRIIAHREPKT